MRTDSPDPRTRTIMRTVAFVIVVLPSVCCDVLQTVVQLSDDAGRCCSATSPEARRTARTAVTGTLAGTEPLVMMIVPLG